MTIKDELFATANGRRVWNQEWTIIQASELICKVMQEQGVSRTELAQRLGKTKGHVSQLLDGQNMTLRTLADVFTALGMTITLQAEPEVLK